ncbi:hypothetical protein PTI98_003271 [Pleurotus ostreatus]|nr:hypothetical protein PTI98_003271 [Pleurotus ostreatus]
MNKWIRRYAQDSAATSICIYRGTTTQMIAAYLRLVVLSLAFQQQLKRGLNRDSYVVQKSIDAARSVIRIMIDKLYPTGTLRYAMEAHFLYVSFAAAFLLNFLRPKLLPLLDEGQYQGIVSLVGQLIDVLGSKEVALDGRHTPALYSRFLSSLLAKHRPKKSEATDTIMNDDLKIYPQYPADRQQTPPNQFSWPDTTEYRGDVSPPSQSDLPDGTVFQQSGEATMDFSLTYFMRSVSQDQPAVGFDPNTRPVVAPMPVQWETYAQELSNLYNENASAQYATSWRPLF